MSNFVVRSMSTTDYRPAWRSGTTFVPEQLPQPYHIYLLEKRIGAYWASGLHTAMKFETEEAAQAEIDRCGLTSCDIVPVDHSKLLNFWEKWR